MKKVCSFTFLDTILTSNLQQKLIYSGGLEYKIHVTSFSRISYYSNVRLISKIELEQNFHSIILDIHASANERPPHLFHFKLRSTNNLLFKQNEHLNKRFNSRLDYLLWGSIWFGKIRLRMQFNA